MAFTQITNPDLPLVKGLENPQRVGLTEILYQLTQISGGGSWTPEQITELLDDIQILLDNSDPIGLNKVNLYSLKDVLNQIDSDINYTNIKLDTSNDLLNIIYSAVNNAQGYLNTLVSGGNIGGQTNLFNVIEKLNSLPILLGSQNLYLRLNTGSVQSFGLAYSEGYNPAFKKMIIEIDENTGATGTLDIEFQVQETSPFIRVPLTDLQATYLGALINPPYNVLGKKIYSIDVSGFYIVKFTPSVFDSSYYYNVSLTC